MSRKIKLKGLKINTSLEGEKYKNEMDDINLFSKKVFTTTNITQKNKTTKNITIANIIDLGQLSPKPKDLMSKKYQNSKIF
jgi:hypothetical protein